MEGSEPLQYEGGGVWGEGVDEDEGSWSRVGQPGRRRTGAGQVRVKQGLSAILRQGQHNSVVHTLGFKIFGIVKRNTCWLEYLGSEFFCEVK